MNVERYKWVVLGTWAGFLLGIFVLAAVGQKTGTPQVKYELHIVTCPELAGQCRGTLEKLSQDGWEVKTVDAVLFPQENWKTRVVLQREVK